MEEAKECLCARCEYLGNAVFRCVQQYVDDGNGGYTTRFLGYSDRLNGEPIDNPSRRCEHEKMQRTLVYERNCYECCQYFKERTWERPKTCGECSLKAARYDDGSFRCPGDPNMHRQEDKACVNGKCRFGDQMTIF